MDRLPLRPHTMQNMYRNPFMCLVIALLCAGCFLNEHTEESQTNDASLPPPVEPISSSIRMHFVGDIMAHRPNFSMQRYAHIYEDIVAVIKDSDLNFANLEFVIDPDRELSSYPTFNVHPDYVHAAIDAGFTIFSVANNHTTDFGVDGVRATQESITRILQKSERELTFSGTRESPGTDYELEIIKIEDFRIGFTALTGLLNDWDGRELVQFAFYNRDREAFLEWIAEIHQKVDFLIVSYHDGIEYVLQPSPRKQEFMRRMAHAGADIVWGHHPHVLQPVEKLFVERKDTLTQALILYSSGNFISGQTWFLGADDYNLMRAYTGDSAIYRVELSQIAGRLQPKVVRALPITHFRTGDDEIVVRRLIPLIQSGELDPAWQRYYEQRLADLRPLLMPGGIPDQLLE